MIGETEFAGRIPPQAVEIERYVLCAVLIDKDALPKVLEILDEESFYNPTHQRYFRAMSALFEKSEPVETVTLVEELKRRGQLNPTEDPVLIMNLSQVTSTSANVEYHCRILQERAIKRSLIVASSEIATRSFNEQEDALDLLDESQAKIFNIAQKTLKKSANDIKTVARNTLHTMEEIHTRVASGGGALNGVTSGFPVIDEMTCGWQNTNLVIVAGRPSQGKTAFALSNAMSAAMDKVNPVSVALFSIEMGEEELGMRMLSSLAKIHSHDWRRGRLNDEGWSRISRAVGSLTTAKIFIDDTPAIGILEIRAKARRLKAEHNIGLVIVDYLQLISGPKNSESREREVSYISRSLKALAKELNVPVMALSQLNRAVEGRTDKRPVLADLRESGAIEQDADVVLFVHRPETYGIKEVRDYDGTPITTENLAEIVIGKQRNGPIGIARLVFKKEWSGFETLERKGEIPPAFVQEDLPF